MIDHVRRLTSCVRYQPLNAGAAAVRRPDLIHHGPVQVELARQLARVPVAARVVGAEVEGQAVLLGQRQEHIHQVDRRPVAALPLDQHLRRVGQPALVAGADQDHRVDADGLHGREVGVPFGPAPVLVRDVVGDLVEERACERHGWRGIDGVSHGGSLVRRKSIGLIVHRRGDCSSIRSLP